MKIGICSDVHLHRYDHQDDVAELVHHINHAGAVDLLICAGDISHRPREVAFFLKRIKRSCPKCWVPGNHDIWVIDKESKQDASAYRYTEHFPELSRRLGWHYLPEAPLVMEAFGTTVVGSIGWFTGEGYSEWHDTDADERDEQLARKLADDLEADLLSAATDHLIVVTHHVPTFKVLDPEKDNRAEVNQHIEALMAKHRDRITLAVHGHRHRRYDPVELEGVLYVAHPFGYPKHHTCPEDGYRIISLDIPAAKAHSEKNHPGVIRRLFSRFSGFFTHKQVIKKEHPFSHEKKAC